MNQRLILVEKERREDGRRGMGKKGEGRRKKEERRKGLMWPMQTMQTPSMSDCSFLPDPAPGHSLVFFLSS